MSRQKGTPKTGGRQKGSTNKVSTTAKQYLSNILEAYMQPKEPTAEGNTQPSLQEDLQNMLPVERARIMATFAGYVIPKQQAITMEEQTRMEEEALEAWIENAPEEAVNAIAAKVLEMQAKKAAQHKS